MDKIEEVIKMTQEQLEKEVIDFLVAGESKIFKALQQQFEHAKVRGRDFTGCGFFTGYEVPDKYKFGNLHGRIDDVHASLKNPDDAILFILWIEAGKITNLEGVQWSNLEWPNDYTGAEVGYALKNKRRYELEL